MLASVMPTENRTQVLLLATWRRESVSRSADFDRFVGEGLQL